MLPSAHPRAHEWRDSAACRGRDPASFIREGPADLVALTLCRACPVRLDCARYALDLLDRGERLVGSWGGVHVPQFGSERARALVRLRTAALVAD
jgi:hypothetical protein